MIGWQPRERTNNTAIEVIHTGLKDNFNTMTFVTIKHRM